MTVKSLEPESSASANSAIPAYSRPQRTALIGYQEIGLVSRGFCVFERKDKQIAPRQRAKGPRTTDQSFTGFMKSSARYGHAGRSGGYRKGRHFCRIAASIDIQRIIPFAVIQTEYNIIGRGPANASVCEKRSCQNRVVPVFSVLPRKSYCFGAFRRRFRFFTVSHTAIRMTNEPTPPALRMSPSRSPGVR